MGAETRIAWADATWNCWQGCSRVSPGCDNCYMFTGLKRYGKDPAIVRRSSPQTFSAPLRWKEPKRIFVCSWSDFFHRDADPWREEAWEIMLKADWHTYMLLTKRPGRMAHWALSHPWPDHIWAGTSVESAKYLPRLDVLARVPAKVRFLSAEPLLSALDVRPFLRWQDLDTIPLEIRSKLRKNALSNGVNWGIVGGESGPHARPMQLQWLEDFVAQCQEAQVAVFVKQDRGRWPGQQGRIPDRLWIQEVPDANS